MMCSTSSIFIIVVYIINFTEMKITDKMSASSVLLSPGLPLLILLTTMNVFFRFSAFTKTANNTTSFSVLTTIDWDFKKCCSLQFCPCRLSEHSTIAIGYSVLIIENWYFQKHSYPVKAWVICKLTDFYLQWFIHQFKFQIIILK